MKFCQGKNKYEILGHEISYIYNTECKYVNLSDIAEMKDSITEKHSVVKNWLKARDTIAMIADAEICQYGETSIAYSEPFSMDIYRVGRSIIAKRGRSGGIYAQEWITCEFLKHLFPEKRYTLNQIFNDECIKAQRRIELSRIRERTRLLLGQVKPNAPFFLMTNIHDNLVNVGITGHTAKALATLLGEDDGYCPSNDFSLEQLDEAIEMYKLAIKKLSEGEYHSKKMVEAYQERREQLSKLSLTEGTSPCH
jgi:hypothetical protein